MKIHATKLFIIAVVLNFVGGYVECSIEFDWSKPEQPEKLFEDFRELDRLLTEKTSSENAIENMKIVETLIPIAESSTFLGFKNKLNLAKAERVFLSLTKLEDPKMCNRVGYEISSANLRAIKIARSPKRIKEIYAYYIERQQEVCLEIYQEMLKERLATMDQDKLRRLDYVIEKSIDNYIKGRTTANGLFSLINLKLIGPTAEKLQKTLEDLPKDFPDDLELNKEGMDLEERQELVASKYVRQPCFHLFDNLALDIYCPASIWIPIHRVNNNYYEFYYNWVRYKFCFNAYKLMMK